MSIRLGRLGLLLAGALVCPALAGAQPVAIEHQDVACIVAGQFPVLDACFRPGPNLAKARVYFRPEGVQTWYYVNSSGPAPPKVGDAADLVCRRTTLPKPKKFLIDKHVEYYVDATGKKQESSQTETFRPLVVKSEGDCKKKVAAFIPNAVVQVFPSLPAAFTVGGGLSGAAVAAVVGAGVAGGTTAVIVATNGGGESGPAPTNPTVTTVAPATVPTTTATTTLPPTVPFNPVFKVFKSGVLEPGNKITGTEPIQLRFFMCESSGPLPLKYSVLVNGSIATAGCDSTITFKVGGFVPGFGALGAGAKGLPPPPTSASYDVLMLIQSAGPGNNPQASRALTVDVTGVPTTTTTTVPTTTTTTSTTTTTTTLTPVCQPGDVTGPTLTALGPPGGSIFHDLLFNYPVPFRVNATDPSGVVSVEYKMEVVSYVPGTGPLGFRSIHTVSPTGDPNPYDWPFTDVQTFLNPAPPPVNCQANGFVWALAIDTCGNQSTLRNPGVISVRQSVPPGCPTTIAGPGLMARPGDEARPQAPDQGPATWVSQLDVPGGRGQVVLNGSEALFPPSGRVPLSARPRSGENRVEAQLVQAQGRAGLWRFELAADSTVAGSVRVIAGQVALVTGDAVVFRLKGQPGERVVFTFRSR